MSPSLLQSDAAIARARRTLDLHRDLAMQAKDNDPLHRSAMQRVFMCEDALFLLVETRKMIARLEAHWTTPNAFQADDDVKAASGS